jgi:hypothetical protein
MSEWIQRLIESKRAYRSTLAALPFEEKIKLLEKLRKRTLSIQEGRRPNLETAILEGVQSTHSRHQSHPAQRPSSEMSLDITS